MLGKREKNRVLHGAGANLLEEMHLSVLGSSYTPIATATVLTKTLKDLHPSR